jgi:hypothetical protein
VGKGEHAEKRPQRQEKLSTKRKKFPATEYASEKRVL